jgi:hypothetical protein
VRLELETDSVEALGAALLAGQQLDRNQQQFPEPDHRAVRLAIPTIRAIRVGRAACAVLAPGKPGGAGQRLSAVMWSPSSWFDRGEGLLVVLAPRTRSNEAPYGLTGAARPS